jgi:LAO/AO transport system kinase
VGNCFAGAAFGQSLEELSQAIQDHHQGLVETGLLGDRLRRKAMVEIHEALSDAILEPILKELAESGEMEAIAERLLRRESDPYTLAEEIARRYLR